MQSIVTIVVVGTSLLSYVAYSKYRKTQKLQQKKAKKLAQRDALIASALASLPKVDKGIAEEILNSTVLQITANITQTRKWTCETVMAVFIRQAIECHKKTNCLTEIMFDEAFSRARQMDIDFKTSGKAVGLLHGIPLSIKDHAFYKGTDATMGIFKFINEPSAINSRIIDHLMAAGCIPFAKTNVPQCLISYECSNPLFGATVNPYNAAYLPGGSSGGEAALIAEKGSILGLGSDCGGSLRIPAHFCGIVTIKPTSGRLSMMQWRDLMPGQESVKIVCGPLARSIDDLAMFMKVTAGKGNDAKVVPLPFNEDIYPFLKNPKATVRKLTVGYCLSDGFTEAMPACKRAVLEAANLLRSAGHNVFEFHMPEIQEMVEAFCGMLSADGSKKLLATVEGNPIDPALLPIIKNMKAPDFIRTFGAAMLDFFGHKKLAGIIASLNAKSIPQIWQLHHSRDEFRQTFVNLWENAYDGTNMDCLLCPPFATPAVPPLSTAMIGHAATYAFLWNTLDFPAGIVPITRVNPKLDVLSPGKTDYINQPIRDIYDVEKMAGLPVGVQVVGLPFHEEQVLCCMKVIEDLCTNKK